MGFNEVFLFQKVETISTSSWIIDLKAKLPFEVTKWVSKLTLICMLCTLETLVKSSETMRREVWCNDSDE